MNRPDDCYYFLLLTFLPRSSAFAAEGGGQGQEGGSFLVWIILLLPTALILGFVFVMARKARRQQSIVETEIERTEHERQYSREHREHLKAQIEGLDQKLSRVIEILSAIEQGQRKGDR
jgi:septal ring factor EnvC (AmiA/AmiB activator)